MRLVWRIGDPNLLHNIDEYVSMSDLHNAVDAFIDKHSAKPTSIKMDSKTLNNFLRGSGGMCTMPMVLEKGKEYGAFIMVGTGLVELLPLEEDELSMGNINGSFIVVDNDEVEKAFEKEVLRVDENPVHRRSTSKDN